MSMANRGPTIVFLLVLLGSVEFRRSEAVDCRRFVFAPVCRGVSAKRAQIAPLQFRDLHIANRLGPSPNDEVSSEQQDAADYDSRQEFQIPDDFLRSLLKKYWRPVAAEETEA